MADKGQGWISHAHTFLYLLTTSPPVNRVSSTTLCFPGEVQGLLSLALQLLRSWVSSPSLPKMVRGEGGRHLSFTHITTWRTRWLRPILPLSHPQDQLAHAPANRGGSVILPRWGTESTLLIAATDKELGKFLISVSDIEEWGQLCPGYCLKQGLHRPQLRLSHLGSISSPDFTMDLGGKQATHISPFLTAFIFLDLPLFTGYEPFSLSFFHTSHYICKL